MWQILATAFLLASSAKAVRFEAFVAYIVSTGMVPERLATYAAMALVALEFWVGLLLCSRSGRRFGALLATGLLSAFVVIHLFAIWTAEIENCRCLAVQLSNDDAGSHGVMLGLNCILLLLSIIQYRRSVVFSADAGARSSPTFAF